jgi:oligopeptidase B
MDYYYWLRDDHHHKRAEIINYLEAENKYAQAMLKPCCYIYQILLSEMKSRVKKDDGIVPVLENGYLYQKRFIGGDYPLHVRTKNLPEAQEEIMLDIPKLAEGHSFFNVDGLKVSPDNRILVYAEDTSARSNFTLRFKNLLTGAVLPDQIVYAEPYVVWAADSKSIFYIKRDHITLRPSTVYYHVLGTDPSTDTLVYYERDPQFTIRLSASTSKKWIFINTSVTGTSEMYAIPADKPATKPRVIIKRSTSHEYEIDHCNDHWIMRTNSGAKNFKIVEILDITDPIATAKERVPSNSNAFIERFVMFDKCLVIKERVNCSMRLRIIPYGTNPFLIEPDESGDCLEVHENPEINSSKLHYTASSLTMPEVLWEVDLETRTKKLIKQDEVSGYIKSNYQTHRIWIPARDGTLIPLSLVYRKDFKHNGTAPLYLHGYGAYGISFDPVFDSNVLSLVDRGFIYAIAHVRGGQELGRDWYDGGRLLSKMNSITDFIDATEYLIAHQYAAHDKVFAAGRSAGGLLIAAAAHAAPHLYRGVAMHVPFLDAITTMSDGSIPLTSSEYQEWGNPDEASYYTYLMRYSPYDTIARKDYPAMLVTTSLWDSQVQYYEPAKYVAKLRAHKTDNNPLLFLTDMHSGHAGKSGRFAKLEASAREYAFFLSILNNDFNNRIAYINPSRLYD